MKLQLFTKRKRKRNHDYNDNTTKKAEPIFAVIINGSKPIHFNVYWTCNEGKLIFYFPMSVRSMASNWQISIAMIESKRERWKEKAAESIWLCWANATAVFINNNRVFFCYLSMAKWLPMCLRILLSQKKIK